MSISEIAKLESRWRENPDGLIFAPLAEAYRKQRDPQRALEILTPGLEKHPDYIPANIVLGRCHWDLNDLPAAERAFTHVLGLDGENVIALKALADISERMMRYDEAERWLETLVGVDRSNDEAREQLERIRGLQRQQAEGSATRPEAAEVATEDAVSVSPLETEQPEVPTIDQPPAPPSAFESTPEPPRLDEAGPVEYIGWIATPDDAIAAAGPLPLEDEPGDLDDGRASPEELAAAPPPFPDIEPLGIEQREDIVLNISGRTEFQATSAADDLMADVIGTPRAGIDDLRRDLAPPEPITSALHDIEPPEPESLSDPVDSAEPDEAEATAPGPTAEFYSPQELPVAEPATTAPELQAAAEVAEPAREASAVEDLGDAPAVAEPELVVTETMAELFLRQGHLAESLTVYRELARRNPGDAQLSARIAELETRQVAAPRSRTAYAAKDTGGQSVAGLFRDLLAARPEELPKRWPSPADPATFEVTPADASATRPAGEPLSLGSVFGDEPPPVAPAVGRSTETAAPSPPSSFDDFFGTAPSPTSVEPRSTTGRASIPRGGDDLDQFHAWLQSLKR